MVRVRKWRDAFDPVFTDRCPIARKALDERKERAMMPASLYRPPTVAPMSKRTRGALSLMSVTRAIQGDQWLSRILDKAEKGGEIASMTPHSADVGDDEETTIVVTDEIRTGEFVTRQRVGIGTTPRKVKKTFMMSAAMILAPVVAGDSWRDIGPELCSEMNWPFAKSYKIMLASAPRRFGKTRFVSMVILNYALSCPGVVVVVFSTSQDTSNLLSEDVRNLIAAAGSVEFVGVKFTISDLVTKSAQKELKIRSPYNLDQESTIYFKPGLNKQNMDKQVCFILLLFFISFFVS